MVQISTKILLKSKNKNNKSRKKRRVLLINNNTYNPFDKIYNRNINLNLDSNSKFFFVQMADSQVGFMKSINDINNNIDNYSYKLEKQMLKKAIKYINILQPAFAIVCGDMTNEWPEPQLIKKNIKDINLSESQEKLIKNGQRLIRNKQIKDYKQITSKSKVPLICLCGNHDVGNIPSNASLREYKKNFGLDYYSFIAGKCKCIIINSQLLKDDTLVKRERMKHDQWLEQELEKADKDPLIERIMIFGHIPLFIKHIDEPEQQYNLPIEVRNEKKLNNWIKKGVTHYFCGHFHQDTLASYTWKDSPNPKRKTLELIITGATGTNLKNNPDINQNSMYDGGLGIPALGINDSGFRIVQVNNQVKHQWYTFHKIEQVIKNAMNKGKKPQSIFNN